MITMQDLLESVAAKIVLEAKSWEGKAPHTIRNKLWRYSAGDVLCPASLVKHLTLDDSVLKYKISFGGYRDYEPEWHETIEDLILERVRGVLDWEADKLIRYIENHMELSPCWMLTLENAVETYIEDNKL